MTGSSAVVAALALNYNSADSDDALEQTVAAGSYNALAHLDDVDAVADEQVQLVVSVAQLAENQQLAVVLFHSGHTQVHSVDYWHQ